MEFITEDYVYTERYWTGYYGERVREWCLECCDSSRNWKTYLKTWQILCENEDNDGILDTSSIFDYLEDRNFVFVNSTSGLVVCKNENLQISEFESPNVIGYNLSLEIEENVEHLKLATWKSVKKCSWRYYTMNERLNSISQVYDAYEVVEILNLIVDSSSSSIFFNKIILITVMPFLYLIYSNFL